MRAGQLYRCAQNMAEFAQNSQNRSDNGFGQENHPTEFHRPMPAFISKRFCKSLILLFLLLFYMDNLVFLPCPHLVHPVHFTAHGSLSLPVSLSLRRFTRRWFETILSELCRKRASGYFTGGC